jgi:hypothetical protein
MTITLKTQLFRGDWDQARSQYSLLWFMEAMCRVNQSHIRQFIRLKEEGKVKNAYPRMYRSGIHYERERGTEEWLDIPTILAGGSYPGEFPGPWDDCEGVSCWRVAELRELPWHWVYPNRKTGKLEHLDSAFPPPPGARKVPGGIAAKPFAKFRQRDDGSYAYHALVLLPDGRLEDPSLTLGMTWEREFHDRDIAGKYKRGELPIQIRYADIPDVVVVDPESPTGYSSDIERAKVRTGLAGSKSPADASCTNMSPAELAAWGYDKRQMPRRDAVALKRHIESIVGDSLGDASDLSDASAPRNTSDIGFRSGRLGRVGRLGAPEANWANRFGHIANVLSVPSFDRYANPATPVALRQLATQRRRRKTIA